MTDWKWFFALLLAALGLTVILVLVAPPASAAPYVYQGDNVTVGETYDLSGVYSFGIYAGQFAYWKNWYYEGTSADPTKIISIAPRDIYNVYIDPAVWNVGNWYKYTGHDNVAHENTFAFRVVKGNSTSNVTPSEQGNKNVTVYMPPTLVAVTVTESPTPTPKPVKTAEPRVVITLPPTPSPSPTFPSPGLPLSPFPVMVGVILAALAFWYLRMQEF